MKLIRTIKNLFPLATRKKIKSHINKFLVPSTQIIPPEIHQEWQNFIHTKSDIINFSLISWDFRFQRPQQLDIELSRLGYRIFYIEHEFISFSKPQDNFAPIQVKKIDNNIYKIIISASRELFIYNDQPSENDKKIILASIKNLINQANIINPIAKIDHPFWSCIADELAMPIIYDCMDNHQGFPESGKDIQQLEKKLVSKSSINLVTSHYLQRQIELLNGQNVHLVKNAADWEHFSNQPKTIPTELKNIPYPIIGYHGGLSDWFDTNILESSLQKFSQCSFVLIGKVENQKLEQLHRKYSNLYLLGEIPYLQVNRYVSQFDVAIIPFKLNELIKAVHPVKIFEYFACGLPVVSTNLPELQEYNSNLYLANEKNFNQQIEIAIHESKNTKRLAIAKKNTWPIRAQEIAKIIIKHLFPKVSVIILSYNHQDLMKKTLDSVIAKSFYPNLEIIVVDNGSDKPTVDLLKKYKNIKLILENKNHGFSKGNNIGLHAATGEYLILLNNDVIVTPGWISRLLFHVQKLNIGLVGPVTNSIGNEALIHIEYDPTKPSDIEATSRNYTSTHWGETLDINYIAAFCWIMSRQTYQRVGDLDEIFGRGMFEDDDYCLRIKKIGLNILIAHDVFIHHFGAASFNPLPEYQQIYDENKLKFENKWHIKWQPHHQG